MLSDNCCDVNLGELIGRQTFNALDLRKDLVASALDAEPIDVVFPESASFEFLNFATNRTKRVVTIEGEFALGLPGFAVSPDDWLILLVQVARRESDLMLVEIFS